MPSRCNHTLYHRSNAGRLQGTWTAEPTSNGPRVSCSECGKFYGYEVTLPAVPSESQKDQPPTPADGKVAIPEKTTSAFAS
jgi:hypothetical protein